MTVTASRCGSVEGVHDPDQENRYSLVAPSLRKDEVGARPPLNQTSPVQGDHDNAAAGATYAIPECPTLARRRFRCLADARVAMCALIKWF